MEYLINLAILFCIYGTLALSLNMVVGMAGLLSLAQAAFYGIGAYAAAIGMTELGLGFFSTLLLGMLANGILAFVVGKILSRFQGDYYCHCFRRIVCYRLFRFAQLERPYQRASRYFRHSQAGNWEFSPGFKLFLSRFVSGSGCLELRNICVV